MICCSSYVDLGCFNACDGLNLGTAVVDGTYTLLIGFNGNVIEYQQDFLALDPLIFNVKLNENYYYTIKRITPSGVSECYKLSTYYASVVQ
jgi:hypothetical protein